MDGAQTSTNSGMIALSLSLLIISFFMWSHVRKLKNRENKRISAKKNWAKRIAEQPWIVIETFREPMHKRALENYIFLTLAPDREYDVSETIALCYRPDHPDIAEVESYNLGEVIAFRSTEEVLEEVRKFPEEAESYLLLTLPSLPAT